MGHRYDCAGHCRDAAHVTQQIEQCPLDTEHAPSRALQREYFVAWFDIRAVAYGLRRFDADYVAERSSFLDAGHDTFLVCHNASTCMTSGVDQGLAGDVTAPEVLLEEGLETSECRLVDGAHTFTAAWRSCLFRSTT